MYLHYDTLHHIASFVYFCEENCTALKSWGIRSAIIIEKFHSNGMTPSTEVQDLSIYFQKRTKNYIKYCLGRYHCLCWVIMSAFYNSAPRVGETQTSFGHYPSLKWAWTVVEQLDSRYIFVTIKENRRLIINISSFDFEVYVFLNVFLLYN